MPDWPARMRAAIDFHRDRPFEWGASDCSLFAEAVEAMTGFDPIAAVRGYQGEIDALRRLRAAGYASTLELVRDYFQEIPPALAQRGDLGYPASIPHALMSPAVIDGAVAYSKHPAGFIVIPRSLITRAFAV